jgi:lysophospholipase L1-like esterase
VRIIISILLFLFSSCSKGQGVLGIFVDPPSTANIMGFGNSIMQGFTVTVNDSAWMYRLEAALPEITVSNYAQNGAGVEYQSKKINEVMPVANQSTILLASGLNDIQFTGAIAKNLYKIQECYRHAITSALLATYIPANDASISITGATSIQDVDNTDIYTKPRSAFVSGGLMQITFGNATISHDFTGTQIGFMFHHQSADYPGTPITYIKIDGVNVDTLDSINEVQGASYTGGGSDMPAVRYYRGLSGGAHTIELVMSGFTDASARFFFDGFFTMQNPSSAPTIIVGGPCYMMQERYDALDPVDISDDILDDLRDLIYAIADEFIAEGYDILKVDQNTYYTPNSTNTHTDYIHPNNRGHGLVFDAWWEVIDPLY